MKYFHTERWRGREKGGGAVRICVWAIKKKKKKMINSLCNNLYIPMSFLEYRAEGNSWDEKTTVRKLDLYSSNRTQRDFPSLSEVTQSVSVHEDDGVH